VVVNAIKGLATGCILSLLMWVVIVWAIAEAIGEGILVIFRALGLVL
jgi:tetrahydromethanopterin S-methyltransferase subunit E